MALTQKLSNAAVNAQADAICSQLNAGKVRIYDGTQPATADNAATGNLLAEVILPNPAFGSAVAGVATANAITKVAAAITGDATWFRCLTSANGTMFDGSVGTSGANCNLNALHIVAGADVTISGFTFTAKKS